MLKTFLIFALTISTMTVYGCKKNTTDENNVDNKTVNVDEGNKIKAPDFALLTLDGEKVKLSDYAGKVVILDFWATWCPPCRRGVPDLISIQKEYKDDLVIIGISLDQPSTQKDIQPFIEEFGINYPVVLGNQEVSMAYGNIRAIPTSFVIDREGNIANKFVGLVPKSTLIDAIKPLLKGS